MNDSAYSGGERGQGRGAPEGSLDAAVQSEAHPYASWGLDPSGPGPRGWNEAAELAGYLPRAREASSGPRGEGEGADEHGADQLPDRARPGRIEAPDLLGGSGLRGAAARDGGPLVVNGHAWLFVDHGMTAGDLVAALQAVPHSYPVVLQMFDWSADQVVVAPVEHVTVCAEEVLLS